jgi:cell division protein FtsZ
MIPYSRDPQQTIPVSAVKIIGLGGAGTNMLERIALDGMEGTELVALNTDNRRLASCLAQEKIQLGVNLTKGLGSGGDPDLGRQSVLESEDAVRTALKGRRIVFLCVGLGGGTGSGAAPIVTRIAREEGAFVVVFASMPFAFEGRRRREQAETSLNELSVLSNALVTFDNNRMGELVVAKQGIHEAFAAADQMICESIKAVIRLVVRPGLINIGLDELMAALRTNRSRCLFGSGIAHGKDRASAALKNALASPLLDQGALLKQAQTVLVHLSGGESLTLFEIELLMQRLQKFVPESAHVLFGAAIDPAMGDSLSITLISALPEDALANSKPAANPTAQEDPLLDPSQGFMPPEEKSVEGEPDPVPEFELEEISVPEPEPSLAAASSEPEFDPEPAAPAKSVSVPDDVPAAVTPSLFDDERSFTEPEPETVVENSAAEPSLAAFTFTEPSQPEPDEELVKVPDLATPWSKPKQDPAPPEKPAPADPEPPKLKLGIKSSGSQSELSLDSAPRGRFEGENPNVFEGEDLDLPPFLRKKK